MRRERERIVMERRLWKDDTRDSNVRASRFVVRFDVNSWEAVV